MTRKGLWVTDSPNIYLWDMTLEVIKDMTLEVIKDTCTNCRYVGFSWYYKDCTNIGPILVLLYQHSQVVTITCSYGCLCKWRDVMRV